MDAIAGCGQRLRCSVTGAAATARTTFAAAPEESVRLWVESVSAAAAAAAAAAVLAGEKGCNRVLFLQLLLLLEQQELSLMIVARSLAELPVPARPRRLVHSAKTNALPAVQLRLLGGTILVGVFGRPAAEP